MCFNYRSHIASVVRTFLSISHVLSFGMGSVAYCIKWSFGLYKGAIFIVMIFSYHVNMYLTHLKSFKHCRTEEKYAFHVYRVLLVVLSSDLSV